MKVQRRNRVVKSSSNTEPRTSRPYYIYELIDVIDSGDGEPHRYHFYVGMTNDPKGRYLQHAAGDDNERKTEYFQRAKEYPDIHSIKMEILDSTLNIEHAKVLEAYWIMYRRLEGGHYLTNTHAGVNFQLEQMAGINRERYDQLLQMLHDNFGCCYGSKKDNWCQYRPEPEIKYVYVTPNSPQADLTKPDGFKDFFRNFFRAESEN